MIPFNDLISVEDCFLGKKRPRRLLKNMNEIESSLTNFLSLLICSIRSWEGLPKELSDRQYIIEYLMFWYGQAVLLKRNNMYFYLPCYAQSTLNVYGESTGYYAYGLNGTSFGKVYVRDEFNEDGTLSAKQDAVLFRNNIYNIPQYFYIKPYLSRLTYIWQTMGIQNGMSRIKLLIYANTEISNKVKDVVDDIINNSDISCVIPSEDGRTILEDIKETNFGGEYTPDDNWTDFDKTFNLMLSMCGIKNNAQQNKLERQTQSEIKSKDMFTEYSKYINNSMRDLAIKQCKEVFNLSLSYKDKVEEKIKQDMMEQAQMFINPNMQGEGGGGGVKDEKPKNDFKKPSPKNK